MASPSIVEIAPRGDVVLVCGSGACTKLRVESKVLALASPVFQAMLDEKKFHEGTTLASYGFVEIPLPDDDPLATKTICQVLHLRFNVLGEHLRPKDLVDIGIVADKYDCSQALSAAAYVWFSRLVDAVDDSGRAELFVAAYLLKQDQLFCQLSHDMVMKTCTKVLFVFDRAEFPGVLREAAGALDRQRSGLGMRIIRYIEDAVVNECTGATVSRISRCADGCSYVAFRGADFVSRLNNSKIWPASAILSLPLENACEALNRFLPSGGSPSKCQGAGRRPLQRLLHGELRHHQAGIRWSGLGDGADRIALVPQMCPERRNPAGQVREGSFEVRA